jgi:hypothetical protein
MRGAFSSLWPTQYSVAVGQAILPAAAFQAALLGRDRSFTTGKCRLKAGCSQDWLPHKVLPV